MVTPGLIKLNNVAVGDVTPEHDLPASASDDDGAMVRGVSGAQDGIEAWNDLLIIFEVRFFTALQVGPQAFFCLNKQLLRHAFGPVWTWVRIT